MPSNDIATNFLAQTRSCSGLEVGLASMMLRWISLHMARAGESRLSIYPHHPIKPAIVDFVLEQITDVELCDFGGKT